VKADSLVVVTDSAKRAALAELYWKGWDIYTTLPFAASNLTFENKERNTTQARVMASALYLADHRHEAPVHVIPCIALPRDRVERQSALVQSALWGSIDQAGRSFMLAARARGLGTTWTCLHLFFEEEAAQLLGIPYAEVNQAALIRVAYTKGTQFQPAPREPLHSMVHWEAWEANHANSNGAGERRSFLKNI
jgi:nitroreductase